MEYKEEKRVCQNCKVDFTVEPEDFNFYEKIKVPPPTFCPECRQQRRLAWRNDRSLYHRKCDLCNNNFILMYQQDTVFPVYCKKCWYSDKWDAINYGINYDFNKTFFDNFKELSKKVPKIGIFQRNVINSEYSNMVGESKNVYLSISTTSKSENIFYSWGIDKSSNIVDCYAIKDSENCYEDIEGEKNYNTQYTLNCKNCIDSYYLVDCINCSNCFLCFNLRNKKFCIKNKQYTQDKYLKELKKINLKSRELRKDLEKDFNQIKNKAVYRFANNIKTINSIGNNLLNTKNCINCFNVYDSENLKHVYRVFSQKDSMDIEYAGKGELMYEYTTGALNNHNVKFSYSAFDNVQNVEYTESCISSKDLFGCISIKSKQYCILNKQYTKEKYFEMVEKIKKHIDEMPYVDKKGRIYKYGEFFPIEISSFSYNETLAQDFFPLSEDRIIENRYNYKKPEDKKYIPTIKSKELPDNIDSVDREILSEILECSHKMNCDHRCTKAFKIIENEFNFYKEHNIPIPDRCPNCRHYERFSKTNPLKLWHRKCMKEGCNNEFETSYAPDRPETVYCESCYNKEVY